MKEKITAGCGMEIRKDEGFVCPYFTRKEEWRKYQGKYGPCQIDLQYGTNVCLHAPKEFFKKQEEEMRNAH